MLFLSLRQYTYTAPLSLDLCNEGLLVEDFLLSLFVRSTMKTYTGIISLRVSRFVKNKVKKSKKLVKTKQKIGTVYCVEECVHQLRDG